MKSDVDFPVNEDTLLSSFLIRDVSIVDIVGFILNRNREVIMGDFPNHIV